MLMHSNILPTFQIRARNRLRTNTTRRGLNECITWLLSEFSQMTCTLYNLIDTGQNMVFNVVLWTDSKGKLLFFPMIWILFPLIWPSFPLAWAFTLQFKSGPNHKSHFTTEAIRTNITTTEAVNKSPVWPHSWVFWSDNDTKHIWKWPSSFFMAL